MDRTSYATLQYGYDMLSIDDVASLALALPETTEGVRHGHRTWFVGSKGFAWERPFSKADLKRFGTERPPDGPIIAVSVADLAEKEATLAEHAKGVFTIAHFEGFPAVLIDLQFVTKKALHTLIIEAWLACAPTQLGDAYLARRGRS